MSVEGLKDRVLVNGWVWVVKNETDGVGGIRVYASWSALHKDFPNSPAQPKLRIEEWSEQNWAESGDSVLFQAVQRDIRS